MNVLVDRTTVQNRLRAVISMEVSLVPAIQVSLEMELPVTVSAHLRLYIMMMITIIIEDNNWFF